MVLDGYRFAELLPFRSEGRLQRDIRVIVSD